MNGSYLECKDKLFCGRNRLISGYAFPMPKYAISYVERLSGDLWDKDVIQLCSKVALRDRMDLFTAVTTHRQVG